MTTHIMEALTERAPLITAAVIICVSALLFQVFLSNAGLSRIPYVGSELGNGKARRDAYLKGGKQIYKDAYEKFKGGVCRITTSINANVVVVSPEFLPELRKLPDDTLSFAEAINESMEAKYLKLAAEQPTIVHTVKANLTPSLVRLNPIIAEEVDSTIKLEIPPCQDWTKVNIYSKLLRIVAIVSGRIFVGPELCHDENYLDAAINYTVDLMTAREAVLYLPPWLRRWKAASLPHVKKLDQRLAEADAFLQPIVTARRMAAQDPDYQKPDDMLQWMMNNQHKFGEKQDRELARNQLGLSFAAIHTTCLTTTNALYNLAAHPELAPELREEIDTVLKEHGGQFSSMALQNMKKMDSFLKETLRMHPASYASFGRKVLKPITLSNGQVIPAGVTIQAPAYGVSRDESVFPDADKFDGLRFYNLHKESKSFNRTEGKATTAVDSSAHNQFISVSQNSLTFGYGRHACPGRFFAANEIKMIMARLVKEFEIKNVDGVTERYPNLEFSNTSVPDPKRELLFKAVSV